MRCTDKNIALFIGRRSGKTVLIAIYLLVIALTTDRIKLVYIGLDKNTAENAIWMHCLQQMFIDNDFVEGIDYIYNSVKKTITFPQNGSKIIFAGADVSYKEIKKQLGGKVFSIFHDEAQDQTQDLEYMHKDILEPAISDYINQKNGGKYFLAGTAGRYPNKENYWYNITKNVNTSIGYQELKNQNGFTVFHWADIDNPTMKDQKLIQRAQFEKDYGSEYQKQSWFRQQYLCEWITDGSDLVYHFDATRNIITNENVLKDLLQYNPAYKYVVATDIGWKDAIAFSLMAWNGIDGNLYGVKTEKHSRMLYDDLGKHLQEFHRTYRPIAMPFDTGGGGLYTAENLKDKYHIPITPAKKSRDKEGFIEDFNSNLLQGKIQLMPGMNDLLIDELKTLREDRGARAQGFFKEAEKYDNHCCDAALYAFADARQYFIKQPELKTTDLPLFIQKKIRDRQNGSMGNYNPATDKYIQNIIQQFKDSRRQV